MKDGIRRADSWVYIAQQPQPPASDEYIPSCLLSLEHRLLSNMAGKPPPYSSPSSVSRSQTSRDEMQSMADEMLRASLTRGGARAAVSSSSMSPPSYRRSAAVPTPPERNSAASRPRPPVLGGTTTTLPDSLTLYGYSKKVDPDSKSSSISSISNSSATVSAADSKAKVRDFQRESQRESQRVKAGVPQRTTEGLFKEACATDLLFLIDTTGSMWNYIKEAKQQVKNIVADIKKAFLNESEVRIAVVGYKESRTTATARTSSSSTSRRQRIQSSDSWTV
jgi:hypothetical protein